MNFRETLIASIQGNLAAQADLLAEEKGLLARRAKLGEELALSVAALSGMREDGTSPEPGNALVETFVPKVSRKFGTGGTAGMQLVGRRRFMADAVKACREIILAIGRPMTVSEIHATHPGRAIMTHKAIYSALRQRAGYAKPSFVHMDGVFWLPDQPLPDGWIHPKKLPSYVPSRVRRRRIGKDGPAA